RSVIESPARQVIRGLYLGSPAPTRRWAGGVGWGRARPTPSGSVAAACGRLRHALRRAGSNPELHVVGAVRTVVTVPEHVRVAANEDQRTVVVLVGRLAGSGRLNDRRGRPRDTVVSGLAVHELFLGGVRRRVAGDTANGVALR